MKLQNKRTGEIYTVRKETWEKMQRRGESRRYVILSKEDDEIKTVDVPDETLDLSGIGAKAPESEDRIEEQEVDLSDKTFKDLDRDMLYTLAVNHDLEPHPRLGKEKLIELLNENNIKL